MQKMSPNVLTPVVSRVEWEWSGVDWGCSGLSAFDSASASVQKSLGRQKLPERTNTWVLGVCVSIVSLQLSRRLWSGHITVNYLPAGPRCLLSSGVQQSSATSYMYLSQGELGMVRYLVRKPRSSQLMICEVGNDLAWTP